jgi:hypothetical protein
MTRARARLQTGLPAPPPRTAPRAAGVSPPRSRPARRNRRVRGSPRWRTRRGPRRSRRRRRQAEPPTHRRGAAAHRAEPPRLRLPRCHTGARRAVDPDHDHLHRAIFFACPTRLTEYAFTVAAAASSVIRGATERSVENYATCFWRGPRSRDDAAEAVATDHPLGLGAEQVERRQRSSRSPYGATRRATREDGFEAATISTFRARACRYTGRPASAKCRRAFRRCRKSRRSLARIAAWRCSPVFLRIDVSE